MTIRSDMLKAAAILAMAFVLLVGLLPEADRAVAGSAKAVFGVA